MADFLQILSQRVLVFDGAMGTQIQAHEGELDVERDFAGLEGCNEILCVTRPDLIEHIHEHYLLAGADAVETNSFGSGLIVLAEYGIADRIGELNRLAAQIARRAADAVSTPDRPRFVVGAMGPGTKLPSLGHTDWDALERSYRLQTLGLIEGGADVLLLETCQDILQAKAAIAGVTDAMRDAKRELPLMVQVTMEATGTMLVGTDIAAALAALDPYEQVRVIGLNCATGPAEMSEHVAHLGRHSRRPISVLPNAGLPQMVGGKAHYPLSPADFARWQMRFVEEDGVAIVGGCCGTTTEHIAALVKALGDRPPKPRQATFAPQVASLFSAVDLGQQPAPLLVGERANANGSRKFREMLQAEDLDGMVAMARDQAKEGAHVIDVCAAYVGRDEARDMGRLIDRLSRECPIPLMIDSTEAPVIEQALKRIGGRAIINSINLEDGEKRMAAVCPMARRYGAAVVALTIDEEGMAKTADRKVAIARRIHDLAVNRFGLRPQDLLFDPLTFTLGSGDEEWRAAGVQTLDAIARIKAELPGVYTLLGLSNISFGLNPEARHVLNSVFMHEAVERGLDAAIVHAARIMPLSRIDPQARELARRLVYDERREGSDPLTELMALFADAGKSRQKAEAPKPKNVEESLRQRIIDGDRQGLDADLNRAMEKYPPLEIINTFLLEGMKVVGDLFGAGEMQLPFVLQSAETMKAAVRHLEPHMEKIEGAGKGRIVLATVKGDVHDIGKNLVDIILTNNGYEVVNLGIKQPIGAILESAREKKADAIGLSGLLVKSTLVMRENLEEMNRQSVAIPTLLGGAALTRAYVEEDLRSLYRGRVFYGKDAFAGLRIMDALMAEKRGQADRGAAEKASAASAGRKTKERPEALEKRRLEQARALVAMGREEEIDALGDEGEKASREEQGTPAESGGKGRGPAAAVAARSAVAPLADPPTPPFWGPRVVERIPLRSIVPYINPVMLFQVQWQFRKAGRPQAEFDRYLDAEVRPILNRLLDQCEAESILQPRAVYGFWPCGSRGDDVVIYDPADAAREIACFTFPRQEGRERLCLSDFFLPAGGPRRDVIGLQIVTVGADVSRIEREWFAADRYRDYFFLHGLGVEAAEGLAEFVHKQVRADLGIGGDDARDIRRLFQQGYRGSRYSFGYPACPHLEDQAKLWPLLEPGRIGVELTEEFQLEPEQSTSAVIVHHPDAKYFNVR
ncbi:MAG: Methionine synthase [Phycisphaerae bacterium]|nr:Methionine synthase [Phycisphaerae bacterium]